MNKLGHVAGCLGLELTADILGTTYRYLADNYYSATAFNFDHRNRLNVITEVLAKAGARPYSDAADIKRWLTSQHRILNGATPVQFISQMRAAGSTRAAHTLIHMAPQNSPAKLHSMAPSSTRAKQYSMAA